MRPCSNTRTPAMCRETNRRSWLPRGRLRDVHGHRDVMTSEVDRQALLRLAREAIVAHVTGAPAPAADVCDAASRLGAAFVTVHNHGELRGCIGHVEVDEPLGDVIARCAVAACSSDPRFPPVTAAELPALDLELSLLGPFEPIAGPDDVAVGRHGLVVEMGWHRGLLLPQ